MINHYATRYKNDYIGKLREDTESRECEEIVFFKGECIHREKFPASNLGSASRWEYLNVMTASIADRQNHI